MNWVCFITIFTFSCVLFRKWINISITFVSEYYVLYYYENKVYMLYTCCTCINKICLNQKF